MPLTNGAEWLTGPAFWTFHEKMFGERFYSNVANVVRVIDALNYNAPRVLDIGGGTGNFAARLIEVCPQVEVDIFERDIPLIKEARKRFKDNPRVVVVEGDLWDAPMPFTEIATCLNVTGYFEEDQFGTFFDHLRAEYLLANFIIYEDNDRKPIQHPTWKRLGRKGMRLSWDIGLGERFDLEMVRLPILLGVAQEHRFHLIAEWKYSDFKHERLMLFRRA